MAPQALCPLALEKLGDAEKDRVPDPTFWVLGVQSGPEVSPKDPQCQARKEKKVS